MDVEREFRDRTGLEMALTEGRATKRNGELWRERALISNNRTYYAMGHVKYGRRPPKLLRVYYAVPVDSSVIVIRHCGDHLPTAGTRRRG